jgi:hypothetical protein
MHKQNQNNKTKNHKKSKNNNIDGLSGQRSNSLVTLPKSVGLIMPDRMYTKLRFYGLGAISISAGFANGARYRPSAAYDVDPVAASTATPGFSEFAAFYNGYRVTCSRFLTRFVNPSATVGVNVVIVPLNSDPGSSPSFATIASWVSNPYAKHKMLGCGGSKSETLSCLMSTEKIFGSKMVYMDDNFSSLTSSIPNNNWYWGVGVIAPASTTVSITTEIDVEMGVEFFSRKVLAS